VKQVGFKFYLRNVVSRKIYSTKFDFSLKVLMNLSLQTAISGG